MNSEIQRNREFISNVLRITLTASQDGAIEVLKKWRAQFPEYPLLYDLHNPKIPAGAITATKMTGANARQVGGDHYEAELQHWDVIVDHGVGYLEGCSSKYVTRTRKKNGLQDLEKSVHYVEKLIEKAASGLGPSGTVPWDVCMLFARANKLDMDESMICTALFRWQTPDDLKNILAMISSLIIRTRAAQAAPGAAG